jgi:hypothetical protein
VSGKPLVLVGTTVSGERALVSGASVSISEEQELVVSGERPLIGVGSER